MINCPEISIRCKNCGNPDQLYHNTERCPFACCKCWDYGHKANNCPNKQ
jgi:hypothetical protein